MTEATLHDILIHTYNADPQLRLHAEQALKAFIATEGSLFALISFLGNHSIHRDLRQAAGIIVKNRISEIWREADIDDAQSSTKLPRRLTADEKHAARQQIVSALLVETDSSIRDLIAESIRSVAEFDYPERWPDLLPTLLTHIQTPDVLKMYNALLAIRKLAKRYEFKSTELRGPLDDIVRASFPILQGLMNHIKDNDQIEAAQVMRMVLKIFWSATMYALPQAQGVDVNGWFQIIGHILQKNLPENSEGVAPHGQPLDKDERRAWPWWKLKKWAAKILSHFIQRYGNPRYAATENEKFAEFFKNTIATPLLGPVMNTLALKTQGKFMTDEVHRYCLAYLASAVELSVTYKAVKPHLDFVLFQVIFPTLCLSAEEVALFTDDPVEFVGKVHDPTEDWVDPRVAATNLLQMLARYRQKDALPRFLPFLESALVEYNHASPETKDYRKKDGILVAIATVFKILSESKTHQAILEPLVINHVLPEFNSPVAFLRSRACWVIEYCCECRFKDKTVLPAILQGLLKGLRDPSLPVQAAAACSMRTLIAEEGAADLLRPYLHEIVQEYFRIMDEVENDAVLSSLEAIVEQYGEEIKDLAPTMVTHLLRAFSTYASAASEDDDAAFSATQCLDTIGAVMDAVQEQPEVMVQLEQLIMPLLVRIISSGEDCFEYIDNAIQLMSYFTYYSDKISPLIWTLCGPFLKIMCEWAYDYMTEIMVPVLNYITKDISTFLSGSHEGTPFVGQLLKVIEKAYNEDTSEYEREAKAASAMLISLLTCAKTIPGSLDNLLGPILTLVLSRLGRCQTNGLRVKVLSCGLACIYYNPQLAVSFLNSDAAVCGTFFNTLFDNLKSMDDDSTQRLVVLSMTSVSTLPPTLIPAPVRGNMQAVFMQCIRELVLIEEEAEREEGEGEGEGDEDEDEDEDDDDYGMDHDDDDDEDEEDEEEEEEEEDEHETRKKTVRAAKKLAGLDVPEGGYDEDEDCVNAEDEEYRAVLERMANEKEGCKVTRYVNGEAVDDEEDDREDFVFTSPIDNMDVTKHFLEALEELRSRDAQTVNALQASLSEEDQERLRGLVGKVATRQQEAGNQGT